MRYRSRIPYGVIAVFCGFVFLLCVGINVYNANATNINKFVASIVDSSTVVQWETKYKKLYINYKLIEGNCAELQTKLEESNGKLAESQKRCDELAEELATVTDSLEWYKDAYLTERANYQQLLKENQLLQGEYDGLMYRYQELGKQFEELQLQTNGVTIASVLNATADNPISLTASDLKGVTSIPAYAFYQCNGLLSIELPSSITSIGYYAFSCCSGLTSITIPNSVTSIEGYAFSECSKLTSITIPNSVTSIGGYAFEFCTKLNNIVISEGVTKIRCYAFRNCVSLASITIPSTATSLDTDIFYKCSGLRRVNLYCSENTLNTSLFSECSSSLVVHIPSSVETPSTAYGSRWNYYASSATVTYVADLEV